MTARKQAARRPKAVSASAEARQAEATDGFVTVEQCGVTLQIPIGTNMPMRAILRFRGLNDDLTPLDKGADHNLLGTAVLLGDEQWAALLAKNPSVEDLNEIGKKLGPFTGN